MWMAGYWKKGQNHRFCPTNSDRPGEGVFREGASLWIMLPALEVRLPWVSRGSMGTGREPARPVSSWRIWGLDWTETWRIQGRGESQGWPWNAFHDLFVPIRRFLPYSVCLQLILNESIFLGGCWPRALTEFLVSGPLLDNVALNKKAQDWRIFIRLFLPVQQ